MNVTSDKAKTVVAENLNARLSRIGWSRYKLSQETGINQMTIGNICNGVHEPSISKLKTIADVLGITVDDIISEKPKKVRTIA